MKKVKTLFTFFHLTIWKKIIIFFRPSPQMACSLGTSRCHILRSGLIVVFGLTRRETSQRDRENHLSIQLMRKIRYIPDSFAGHILQDWSGYPAFRPKSWRAWAREEKPPRLEHLEQTLRLSIRLHIGVKLLGVHSKQALTRRSPHPSSAPCSA